MEIVNAIKYDLTVNGASHELEMPRFATSGTTEEEIKLSLNVLDKNLPVKCEIVLPRWNSQCRLSVKKRVNNDCINQLIPSGSIHVRNAQGLVAILPYEFAKPCKFRQFC